MKWYTWLILIVVLIGWIAVIVNMNAYYMRTSSYALNNLSTSGKVSYFLTLSWLSPYILIKQIITRGQADTRLHVYFDVDKYKKA